MENQVICADCLVAMKDIPDKSIDSIVTDPPYHLVSIVKRFGKEGSAPAKQGKDGSFARLSGGFMGKTWDGLGEDGIGIANNPLMWAECLRVLKPGGYLLSFGGTRTYHRMACAIENAGFEVRDMIEWVYGSGFPKSLNIGKAVDKIQGNEREVSGKDKSGSKRNCMAGDYTGGEYDLTKGTSEWEGWGTALKPAHEPICMARKPLAEKTVAENVLKYGTGGINIDESRVEIPEGDNSGWSGSETWNEDSTFTEKGKCTSRNKPTGRFPANLITDGSEEVRECFPESNGSGKARKLSRSAKPEQVGWGMNKNEPDDVELLDAGSGNASRFFKSIIYQAKASKSERNKGCEGMPEKRPDERTETGMGTFEEKGVAKQSNFHPTVKPIALMEYLIKMVTPKGGIVLDPFAGSGSTLVAAKQNGYGYIGIEMTEEYIPIIEARLSSISNTLF